jgi:hypothetical protein
MEIMDIVPHEERCQFCQKLAYTKLCDWKDGYISNSIDFIKRPNTCDRRICDECAVNLATEFDLCPKHADIARRKLGMSKT